MLEIEIPGETIYDDETEKFVDVSKTVKLTLEHSLISLSKWEAKYERPFLGDKNQTVEETLDYIKFMTVTRNVDDSVYDRLTRENSVAIASYIAASNTATTFNSFDEKPSSREVITSEIIYYWMVALSIPFECEKWHINRLLTLIRVINEKNKPEKKIDRQTLIARQRELNEARKKKLNTKG